jgi:hypothetical protein
MTSEVSRFCPPTWAPALPLEHWRFVASGTSSRSRSRYSITVNWRWNGWTVFHTSRHDLRRKDQTKCQGENLCLTDFACFLYTLVTVLREMHSQLSIRIYKNDVKRCTINPLQRWIARQPMVVLLTLEGNCSCRRAKPAHFGCHLPSVSEGIGRLAESSTELASIIDFFGSRFDQAKISVARTTLEAEDAREWAEIRTASFPLKNDLLSWNKEACGSCVEPSSLKIFGSMFDTGAIYAQIPSKIQPIYQGSRQQARFCLRRLWFQKEPVMCKNSLPCPWLPSFFSFALMS